LPFAFHRLSCRGIGELGKLRRTEPFFNASLQITPGEEGEHFHIRSKYSLPNLNSGRGESERPLATVAYGKQDTDPLMPLSVEVQAGTDEPSTAWSRSGLQWRQRDLDSLAPAASRIWGLLQVPSQMCKGPMVALVLGNPQHRCETGGVR